MRASRSVALNDTDPFRPDAGRPVRVRARSMPADAHFDPHRHPWAQLAYCATGMVQVSTAASDHAHGETTYIVPPSRAVCIAPGALHSVHVMEAAELRTLYIDASATPADWATCRALVVSPLLREMVPALDDTEIGSAREALLTALVLDELRAAPVQPLGVPLPSWQTGDKRLRTLCEAVLRTPGRRATLA
ncbi:MAG: AraC family transcriptional regulator, partial [Comamonadaceae bacterium]